MPSPPAADALSLPKRSLHQRVLFLTAVIGTLLLANFLFRLPTWQVADWGQFAFYDPGTVLKGDSLLAKGYVPTVDFGYTHGLLSLLYGRLGFALLGRTPFAFLLLTLLTEAVMAWAIARILVATEATRSAIVLFCLAIPMTIMPAYLTLTHPLEAMLILLALAAHAESKRSHALTLLTVCLFVKPSMAYVYGFLLVLLILVQVRRPRLIIAQLLPALVTLLVLTIGLSLWMGPRPVASTLLPLTGAKTYAATGFGFFAASGRAFWMPASWSAEFFTPAAAFLLATTVTIAGALYALRNFFRSLPSPRTELLLTLGILQSTFLLGFYGWTGSWTYYAYLPALGLVIALSVWSLSFTPRIILSTILGLLLILAQTQLAGDVYNGWNFKLRNAATAHLWADPEQFAQWQEALAATQNQPTLLMTNGYLSDLPPTVTLPDAWFPEPGIPTAAEVTRVQAQADTARRVIIWWEYRQFDLWNSPSFSTIRDKFHPIFHNGRFTVCEKSSQ